MLPNKDAAQMMLRLFRAEVCDKALLPEECAQYTSELCDDVLKLSRKYGLDSLAAYAMLKYKLCQDTDKKLYKAVYGAMCRYERNKSTYEQLCRILETAQVPFIPLKGLVIRDMYPQPWMRTSCDIDILVPEEMLDQAVKALEAEDGFQNQGRGYHDVPFVAPNGVYVELHFSLIDGGKFPQTDAILNRVWSEALPVADGGMQHTLPDGLFYFHHILHMVDHFYEGGCGIRPFLDLWILDNRLPGNKNRDQLLTEGHLITFANAARQLTSVWLESALHSELTYQMEQYIFNAGMYGGTQNKAAIQQIDKGGKLKSLFYQVFLPYSTLKGHYPIIQKYRWLTPFCQIARWFRLLNSNRRKRAIQTMKANNNTTKMHLESAESLLQQLGLI